MAKKKLIPQESPKPKFSNEEIQAALEIMHSEYFMNVLGLLSHKEGIGPFSYVNVPVITPDGGTYLVSIMHVDGPKVDLASLAKLAESKTT